MKKKSIFLVLAFSLILLANMSVLAHAIPFFPPVTTLQNQPPADATDCQATFSADGVGWLRNGYVQVSFNTTAALLNMSFYRDTTQILTIDFFNSYLNIVGGAGYAPLAYNKTQYYNATAGWIDWNSTSPYPNQYVDYRNQIQMRVLWQDNPRTYLLIGYFTLTRGMPWIQADWAITNYAGAPANVEFHPYLLNYLSENQTILSSTLKYWNETTNAYSGNAWGGEDPWFTVGFTTNGTIYNSSKTRIFLNDTTYEDLSPLNNRAINGHSRAALWNEDFVNYPYQYNYTFVLANNDTVAGWHYAELWVPSVVQKIDYYYSQDNGTTWSAGIGYNYTSAVGSGTTFHTSNGTSVNATMYDVGIASGILGNKTGTTHANATATYQCSSLLGVIDRTAFGVWLGAGTTQNPLNSSSTAFVKVQVYFDGPAEYDFAYAASPAFTVEPGQGYGLLNQTGGRLTSIAEAKTNASAWAIGMNESLASLKITDFANRNLEFYQLSWNKTLAVNATGQFTTNIFGFLSIDTTAHAIGDTNILDIFKFGADNPYFQFYEALGQTYFAPLFTTPGGYELWWIQRLTTTDWGDRANYTLALPHPNTVGGWHPTSAITSLGITRSGSPIVSLYSGVLDLVDFRIITAGSTGPVVPPLGTTPPATSSPFPTNSNPLPSATLAPSVQDTLIALVIIAIIIVFAIFLIMRRRR